MKAVNMLAGRSHNTSSSNKNALLAFTSAKNSNQDLCLTESMPLQEVDDYKETLRKPDDMANIAK